MNVHTYFIAALLLVSVVFAGDRHPSEPCDQWTNKVGAVATAWTASIICPDPIWKKGTKLLYVINIGVAIKLYPREVLSEPSCIDYVEDTVRKNVENFSKGSVACERMKSWISIKEMRDKLLVLGLIKVD